MSEKLPRLGHNNLMLPHQWINLVLVWIQNSKVWIDYLMQHGTKEETKWLKNTCNLKEWQSESRKLPQCVNFISRGVLKLLQGMLGGLGVMPQLKLGFHLMSLIRIRIFSTILTLGGNQWLSQTRLI